MARLVAWVSMFALVGGGRAQAAFDCHTLEAVHGRGTFTAVAGDWNGDGRLDLAASYVESGTVGIFINRGERRFELTDEVRVGEVPRGIAVADVNGDRHVDLAVGSATSYDVVVLLGDGSGLFVAQPAMRGGFHAPFHLLLEDLDGDRKRDLIVVNECNWPDDQRPGRIGILQGKGDGTFRMWQEPKAGISPSYLLMLDVDGRHGKDLVVANWRSSDVSLLLRAPDGTFAAERRLSIPEAGPIYGLAALDFNGDGLVDVAATDLAGRLHLLRGSRSGFTFERSLATAGTGTRDVDAVDVDGDGRLDLVAADQRTNDVSWLRGLPQGAFAPAVAIPVGLRPRTVTPVDLDADGRLDLVVANQGAASLSILYGSKAAGAPCATPPVVSPEVR